MKPTKYLLASLAIFSNLAFATSPYISGDPVAAGDVNSVGATVSKKLKDAGFEVIGTYHPKGIEDSGVVVATDKGMLDAIAKTGGDAIVGAAIRVGFDARGQVSYMNPEYWYRAYLRKNYSANENAVKALEAHLKAALGAGKSFGGDVDESDLAKYHYMFGMEYFDDDRDLATHDSFEKAVDAVRANLAKGVADTSEVYEVVMPERKIAVFGVAMNNPKMGDGMWVSAISGKSNIAALPYEVFVDGNKTEALYGRYRIALSWPSLTMVSFGRIMSTPGDIKSTLEQVAK